MLTVSRVMLAAAGVLIAAVAGKAAVPVGTHAAASSIEGGVAWQELPDGPGKALLPKLCAGCHDLTFTVSTRETEEGWTRIVNDMRSKGADGSEEDFAKVIVYLATYMGKPAGASPRAQVRW